MQNKIPTKELKAQASEQVFERPSVSIAETKQQPGFLKQNFSVPALPPQELSMKFKIEKSTSRKDSSQRKHTSENSIIEKDEETGRFMLQKVDSEVNL